MDSRNCQTPTASPAEPGGLLLTLGIISFRQLLSPGNAWVDAVDFSKLVLSARE